MVPALAWKLVLVAVAGTVIEAEKDKPILLSEIRTAVPPVGAAIDRVTVQVVEVPEVRLFGAHWSPETAGNTLIDPPVPVMFASVPLGSVPIMLLIGRESTMALLLGERVAVIVASTPLVMVVAFTPDATQINVPTPELQLSVFPAAVSTGPATALSAATFVAEYVNVHCTLAGAPEGAFKERVNGNALPLSAVPDAKLRVEP
jgi:hypothetical protein